MGLSTSLTLSTSAHTGVRGDDVYVVVVVVMVVVGGGEESCGVVTAGSLELLQTC